MNFLYLKALHIIFVVTWFAGLFYIVRLFIYQTEAMERPAHERDILKPQLDLMASRLWYIIIETPVRLVSSAKILNRGGLL